MRKNDIKIQINEILWEMALEKIENEFGKKYCKTDSLLIIMLLAVYKMKSKLRTTDIICIWQLIIQTSLLHLHINP